MSRLGAIVALSCLVACGDDPICPQNLFVALQTSEISVDTNAAAAGVQSDIRVRTSLSEGEDVTLEVDDETFTTAVDATGLAVFEDVTVTAPATRIRASVDTSCGTASDELLVPVSVGPSCALTFSPEPVTNAFYAPAKVFNLATGNQTAITVTTIPGSTVELFQNSGTGEVSLGVFDAGDDGTMEVPTTLVDGAHTFRAFCTRGDTAAVSPPISVVVDVTPPTCTFVAPAVGTTITPSFDNNLDLSDGIQLLVTAQVTGTDTQDETTTLTVGGSAVSSTKIDIDGQAGGFATLAATPGNVTFEFTAHDHAQNLCSVSESYNVVLDGCDMVITSPTAPVTVDAAAATGSQVDIALQVSNACVGRTVTSDCGDDPSGVVGADGTLTLRATLCGTSPCEASELCTFTVSTPDGVVTSTSTTIAFDDQGPETQVAIVSPALACGSIITPAQDADPNTDGVQLVARVTSAGTRSLKINSSTVDATNDVTFTLAPGTTTLQGIGVDALGNIGASATCTVTLADITVSFAEPAADGLLNRKDGVIAGSDLAFQLCGSVNRTGASVSLNVDGGAPLAASVIGTSWCRNVTLSEASHTIVATATAGASSGNASLVLRVDLTVPPAVDNFAAVAVDRRSLLMTFDAPSDGGAPVASYVIKASTTPMTDANFDDTGIELTGLTPAAPGTEQTLTFAPALLQFGYFLGIATFDAAGNRSVASIAGPLSPFLDRSGAITSPNASLGSLRFGTAIAYGRFNDDDIDDLAISAPTQNAPGAANAGAVYIYFGSSLGISNVPDVTITSTVANGRFGAGLAAVRWSSSSRDDLVVGAPGLATHGQVSIFRAIAAGARDAATADATITVDAAAPGSLAAGALGSWLVTGDFDGEGTPDLVIAAPTAAANNGGVVVVYGDTFTGSGQLSDVSNANANGVIAALLVDPTSSGRQFGRYLHAVGPTLGAFDATDDLVIGYVDDATTLDRIFVMRGDDSRPSAPGLTVRAFTPARDARIDYVTTSTATELGSQATTTDDRDGDGTRDLLVSAYLTNGNRGQVLLLAGGITGSVSTSDPGVTLTTINGTSGQRLGALVLARSDRDSDVDGATSSDLVIAGRGNSGPLGFLWYGDEFPLGTTTTTSASTTIPAPAGFRFGFRTGAQGVMQWVGDLDDDGLEDVCWASPITTGDDGMFEVFD